MDRRPTIIDVARKAGVSKSTVSLVLQNSRSVRKETRELVQKTMAEIGYVYNRAAANLRMSNAGLVGLVINDLRNPFFAEFATSVQMTLSSRGYVTVVANTDENSAHQAQVVEAMLQHGVSAIIITPAYGDDAGVFDAIARAEIPTMQVLRRVDERVDIFPYASPNYLEGGRVATEHLLKSGAENVAFIGGLEGRDVTRERMAGYQQALEAEGKKPFVWTGQSTKAFGRDAARKLAEEWPEVDAVLCFNDLVALGLLTGCSEIGRKVGQDFQVIGFDDIEDCVHAWPALSSIRCDVKEFGKGIAATILAWLEEGKMPAPETRTDIDLVVRQSSR